ncbi:OmpA family protein [Rhodopseudomonas pseudopalustris]|uniref:OmpA family protein n=1 Tax=Rhodopseudomonas pseudopalustris TaxID=1513892 RepID=UPI003F968A66
MSYFLMQYWGWLAAAVAAGVATPLLAARFGWTADLEDYWLKRVGLVAAVPVLLLVMQVVTGKGGLLLEVAVALLVAYVVGGVIGGVSTKLMPVRYEGWWVGLFATGVIWIGFAIIAYPKIEPDLRERVVAVVEKAGGDPINLDIAGRDVLLPTDIEQAKRAELVTEILLVEGVRRVTEVEDLTGPAQSAKTIAKLNAEAAAKNAAEAAAKEAAAKAAEEAAAKEAKAASKKAKAAAEAAAHEAAVKEAAAKEAATKEAAAKEAAAKEAAAKEAAAKEAAAKDAAKDVAKPAPAQTADAVGAVPAATAATCQSKLTAVVAAEKINFERGSAEITKPSLLVIDKLTTVLTQCPAVAIEVAGHTDAGGKKAANQALSQRRAEAVVDTLSKKGVGAVKLTAVGYGSSKPIASNDNAEGRNQNRRIEFVVK